MMASAQRLSYDGFVKCAACWSLRGFGAGRTSWKRYKTEQQDD